MNIQNLMILIALPLITNGCTENNRADRQTSTVSNQVTSTIATDETDTTDKWLGTWQGPEGTFLKIADSNGKFVLTIQNLDGPRKFEGKAVKNQIQFERDGHQEFILATDGTKTGMKWLSEKNNCLTIRYGEGYCRD